MRRRREGRKEGEENGKRTGRERGRVLQCSIRHLLGQLSDISAVLAPAHWENVKSLVLHFETWSTAYTLRTPLPWQSAEDGWQTTTFFWSGVVEDNREHEHKQLLFSVPWTRPPLPSSARPRSPPSAAYPSRRPSSAPTPPPVFGHPPAGAGRGRACGATARTSGNGGARRRWAS